MRRHHRIHLQHCERSPLQRIGLGLFVIAVGALALLNNLGVFNVFGVLQFWPVFFIIVGGMQFFHHRARPSRYLLGGGLMTLGVLLALRHAGYLAFNLYQWWPLALIFAGLMVIARGFGPRRERGVGGAQADEHGDTLRATVVMGGSELRNDSQDFKGGEVSVVMGGVELDLTRADIQSEAVLNVDALLGGLEIRVPAGWTVQVEAAPVMGGVEDRTVPGAARDKKLILRGSIIMSGVEIRN